MIVRQFLRWVQTASPGERADATSALARAFLYSPLDPVDRASAEAAMTVLLDDPSPMVRQALATALGGSHYAPSAVIHALAHDQGDIAATVLAQSPVLSEAELIDAVAHGDWRAQCAVACRLTISVTLAGALSEIAGADACLALLQNSDAIVTPSILARIAERHGQDGEVRAELLARDDLPADARQVAISALTTSLSCFVVERGWLTASKAERVAAEASDKATIAIAGLGRRDELTGLVRHLMRSGQLTPALILRALLSQNLRLFEEALAQLSGMPVNRVSGFVHGRRLAGFEALYDKAGLPRKAFPAFQAALDAMAEQGSPGDAASEARLSRRMTERVLTAVEGFDAPEMRQLLLMLRRFAAEAARDEARAIAGDLVRDILIAA